MSELALSIILEKPDDADTIDRLHERAFGPGRFARTAFRLREGATPVQGVDFVARVGTLIVGSVRQSGVRIGEKTALVLGPLTVEPAFRSHGIGKALLEKAISAAKMQGHGLIMLIGDEQYYGRVGFKRMPMGRVKLPGPYDPMRLMCLELIEGYLADVKGLVSAA